MALDERFIPLTSLNEYFVDKDSGLPLAGGTIEFFRDNARSTTKTVFQLTGTPPNYEYTALPNPVSLNAVGTVENASNENVIIYAFPFDAEGEIDLYFLICRNSAGVEQWTREAIPNLTAGNDPTDEAFPVTNQIANPQFSRIFLNEGEANTYTVTAATDSVFPVGPDWDLIVSGTGSVDVQRIGITGNEAVVTSPPYVLDIQVSGGITKCFLRQRMNVNSGLWASTSTQDIFLAGAFVARNENVGTTGLQLFYEESTGGAPVKIVDETFDNSGYVFLRGTTANPIPTSTNTDIGDAGFIDIYLSIEANQHVRVSSLQTVPTTSSAGGDLLQYDLQTSNREQALMGDFFVPALEAKPAPSLLVGWDFPLNPSQLGSTGNIGASGAYIWDQTIAARGGSIISYARSADTAGLEFTTSGTNDAFYILQYLDGAQAKKILGTALSVNVNGWKSTEGDVTMRVYLARANAAALFPTLGTTIGTLSSSGEFTVNVSGWAEIPRGGLETAKVDLTTASTLDLINTDTDYGFVEWEVTSAAEIADTDKFAIVVTFGYAAAGSIITIDSVSVIPGDIPCRPGPQNVETVLEECQYFYEKSYNVGAAPESIGTTSSLLKQQLADNPAGNTIEAIPRTFGFPFKSNKRIISSEVHLYTPASPGTIDNVFVEIRNGGSTLTTGNTASSSWTEANLGNRAVAYKANTVNDILQASQAVSFPEAYIEFHYTVDARIGLV